MLRIYVTRLFRETCDGPRTDERIHGRTNPRTTPIIELYFASINGTVAMVVRYANIFRMEENISLNFFH